MGNSLNTYLYELNINILLKITYKSMSSSLDIEGLPCLTTWVPIRTRVHVYRSKAESKNLIFTVKNVLHLSNIGVSRFFVDHTHIVRSTTCMLKTIDLSKKLLLPVHVHLMHSNIRKKTQGSTWFFAFKYCKYLDQSEAKKIKKL